MRSRVCVAGICVESLKISELEWIKKTVTQARDCGTKTGRLHKQHALLCRNNQTGTQDGETVYNNLMDTQATAHATQYVLHLRLHRQPLMLQ